MVYTMQHWPQHFQRLQKNVQLPLVLTAFFGFFLIYSIWQFGVAVRSPHTSAVKMQKPAPISMPNIANQHLFGIYVKPELTAALPISQLQLSLSGTFYNESNPTASYAILSSPGSTSKVYKVGDLLPGNVKLSAVHTKFIVINDNGQLEKLLLPIQELRIQE